jgi:small subunit ribosomal protein S9
MAEATAAIDPSVTAVIPAPEAPAEETSGPKSFIWGTGRRKTSVARVRIAPGSGKIHVNERELNDYFSREPDRKAIFAPLEAAGIAGKVDVWVNSEGGGTTGQSGAIVMGLARAIVKYDATTEANLRNGGFLTRDSRMKERKKYGQRGARRRFQFSKR